MTGDRTERIKALSKLALGIVRRCGERCCIERAGGRHRVSEVRHNEFRLTLTQSLDDEDRTSALDVRFDGKTVLHIEWTAEKVLRTSYRPGAWEDLLRRYDRIPALAVRVEAST
ncbi:hypothetical protein IVB14_24380 [Bradyrhizobium sp. 180]|uniref:hypothetical protein n=1 Tax=Bradyrhizobium sp. 180 TaxID=2782650 RepID=UPI001FFA2F1F|nr:hypothetical protein [Bradyrhizobium sp. 180]MCK1493475.1 hypothetical protein [Bradyrhizobium sp. 180]